MRKTTVSHILADVAFMVQQQVGGNYATHQLRRWYLRVEQDIYNRMVNRGAKDLFVTVAFTWSANSTTLVLPKRYAYVSRVRPPLTGSAIVLDITPAPPVVDIIGLNDLNANATMAKFFPSTAVVSDVPVLKQPLTGGGLTVVSTSTADVDNTNSATQARLLLTIESYGPTGERQYEQVALNGTTAVACTKTHVEIIAISKTIATAGDITIADSDASTLAVLGFWEEVSLYSCLSTNSAPASDSTFTCLCAKTYQAPMTDASQPFMAGIDAVLVKGVVEWCKRETRDEQPALSWDEWLEREIAKVTQGYIVDGGALEGPSVVCVC